MDIVPPDTPIPLPWLQLLQRMMGLERGRIHDIRLVLPEGADEPPLWTVDGGKLEGAGNGKRKRG